MLILVFKLFKIILTSSNVLLAFKE